MIWLHSATGGEPLADIAPAACDPWTAAAFLPWITRPLYTACPCKSALFCALRKARLPLFGSPRIKNCLHRFSSPVFPVKGPGCSGEAQPTLPHCFPQEGGPASALPPSVGPGLGTGSNAVAVFLAAYLDNRSTAMRCSWPSLNTVLY